MVYLHFDMQSFIFLLLRKKNKWAQLVIQLASKLDFPLVKAISKKKNLFEKSKIVGTKGINESTQEEKASNNTNKAFQRPFSGWKQKGCSELCFCRNHLTGSQTSDSREILRVKALFLKKKNYYYYWKGGTPAGIHEGCWCLKKMSSLSHGSGPNVKNS